MYKAKYERKSESCNNIMDNVRNVLRNKKKREKILNYAVLTLITYTLYKMVVM